LLLIALVLQVRIPATQHNYVHFGSNLKFTDLQAVIGIEQMKKLDSRVHRKREIMRRYKRWLPHLPDDNGQYTPWYIYTCTAYRDKMIRYLYSNGIATQRFYPAVHKTKAYSDYNHLSFPNAETLSRVGLWLPSSLTLTNEDIDYVGGKVKEFYDEVEI
jgi:perosamine synthetase